MGNVVLLALGTDGDVRPVFALAHALPFPVTVVSHEEFRPLAESLGLPFLPLTGDFRSVVPHIQGSPIRAVPKLLHPLIAMVPELVRILNETAPDLLICQSVLAPIVKALRQRRAFRTVFVSVAPELPTRAWASTLLPDWTFPRLSYVVATVAILPSLYQFQQAVTRAVAGPVTEPSPTVPDSHLGHWSPTLAPKPSDWPAHVHVTGYWKLSSPDWKPFFDDAPVYVGFGSMGGTGLAGVVREALEGRSAVVQGLGDGPWVTLPPAPHDQVFPHCSVIVHHGGCGTTHTALAAGVPQVVIPFAVDQHFWGRRVEQLGVGVGVPLSRLTPESLRSAIQQAENCASRAAEVGELVQQEDGLGNALEQIERLVPTAVVS